MEIRYNNVMHKVEKEKLDNEQVIFDLHDLIQKNENEINLLTKQNNSLTKQLKAKEKLILELRTSNHELLAPSSDSLIVIKYGQIQKEMLYYQNIVDELKEIIKEKDVLQNNLQNKVHELINACQTSDAKLNDVEKKHSIKLDGKLCLLYALVHRVP